MLFIIFEDKFNVQYNWNFVIKRLRVHVECTRIYNLHHALCMFADKMTF